jgi:hypothetical protein
LIRHAGLPAALAVPLLAVAMIQPAFWALLIQTIGVAVPLEPHLAAALHTAIAVSPITVLADQEQNLASRAKPLPKHHLAVRRRHGIVRAGLDNGDRFVAPWNQL